MTEKDAESPTSRSKMEVLELVRRALRKVERLDLQARRNEGPCRQHSPPTYSYDSTGHASRSPSVVPVSPYHYYLSGTSENPPSPVDTEPSPPQSKCSTLPSRLPLSPLAPLLVPSSDELSSFTEQPSISELPSLTQPPSSPPAFSSPPAPLQKRPGTPILSMDSSATLPSSSTAISTTSALISSCGFYPPPGLPPPPPSFYPPPGLPIPPPLPPRTFGIPSAPSPPEVPRLNLEKSIPTKESTLSKWYSFNDLVVEPSESDCCIHAEVTSLGAGQVTPPPFPRWIDEMLASPIHAQEVTAPCTGCEQFDMMSLQRDEVHLTWVCCKFHLTGFVHSICAWNGGGGGGDGATDHQPQRGCSRHRKRTYLNKLEDWYSRRSLKERDLNILMADMNTRVENFVSLLLLRYTPVGHEEPVLKCVQLLDAVRIEFAELLEMRRAILETFPGDAKSMLWVSNCTLEIIKGLREFEFNLSNLHLGRIIWPNETDAIER